VLRTSLCVIALAAIVAAQSTVQAADARVALACRGTVTETTAWGTAGGAKPEPVSMGIIVNFTDRTVQGLVYPVKITAWDEITVTFGGSYDLKPTLVNTRGAIDRVTGDLEAVLTQTLADKEISSTTYALKCRPTQRMF
jgi:hypothetical protein